MEANTIMIIGAVVVLLLILAENIISKRICDRLTQYIYTGQFDKYVELRSKGWTKYLIHPFNLFYSDFNKAIIQGNKEEIDASLDNFDNMRLNKRQKAAVYSRAFYYFILQRNKDKATRYYHLTRDLGSEENMRDMSVFYNTFIEKGYDYLDEMLEELETVPAASRSDYESVISRMYENKGDAANAKKYKDMAESHFDMMERATKANWQ